VRRILTPIAVVLALSAVGISVPSRADAAADWVWDDPIVAIGGQSMYIRAGVYGEPAEVDKNVKVAQFVISVPESASVRVIGRTHVNFPETVRFVRTGERWQPGEPIPVHISLEFKAKTVAPAILAISYPGGATSNTGTTASPLSASFSLP
jgi:hypothetical protein